MRRSAALLLVVLQLSAAGCVGSEHGAGDRGGPRTAVLDSTSPGAQMVGTASPDGGVGDSASRLDARFQRERDAINRDVMAMRGADRRSPNYARRFDDIRRRTIAAESLRAARDRLRRARP